MMHELKEILRSFNPTRAQLIWFGMLLSFFISLGAIRALTRPSSTAPVLFAAAAVILAAAILAPKTLRPALYLLTAIAFPIGWMVSRLILMLFFYIALTPMAFLLRLIGKDPMPLSPDREKRSYWEDFEPNRHPDSMRL